MASSADLSATSGRHVRCGRLSARLGARPGPRPPTEDHLLEDPKLKEYIVNSFLPLSPDATLADAKDLLDKNPQCLDILVTQDGTKNGIVIGWITNVMVLNAATI